MLALCIESSHQRGLGHLFRCIHLAREMERREKSYIVLINPDARSEQILRDAEVHYETVDLWDFQSNWEQAVIKQYGINVWLNDRMGTDYRHAIQVKAAGVRLCSIDDTGTGANLCDINIIPIPSRNVSYSGQRVLSGVEYLVLNPEIARFRRTRTQQNKIVVSLGGSDTYGVTVKVASYLRLLHVSADIVLGPAFSHEDALFEVLQNDSHYRLLRHVDSLPALFYDYDIAITGGGGTPYEAAAAGLPCVIIANEPHEEPLAQFLADSGCAVFTCFYADLTCTRLQDALASINLVEMSQCGQRKFHFNGTQTVLKAAFGEL